MRLGGSINDALDPMLLQQASDEVLIGDVAVDKSISRVPVETLCVRWIAGILEGVEIHDLMTALNDETPDKMRADEPRPSRHQNVHASSSLFAPVRLTS
jgi:hypothetical protein